MKKIFKYALLFMAACTMTMGFTSCSDDNDNDGGSSLTEKEVALRALTNKYVNNVIYPTYGNLAAQTEKLYDLLEDATDKFNNNSLTQSDIDEICNTFLSARSYWEKSEAFLYGAATDFGIDPHIDTWPLDVKVLANTLKDAERIEDLQGEDGIEYARANLGEQLLGFHGIEFIIFRDGQNRKLTDLKAYEKDENFAGSKVNGRQELIYATAVAGDLRDKCYQMEVAWMGEKAPQAHVNRVEECEFTTTVNGVDGLYYGNNMLNAGNAGSTYASWFNVAYTILVSGCSNIAVEVADQKMGQANRGDDVNYIESPYSKKSFTDFYDNIASIKNSLYGNYDKETPDNESIMSYLRKYNNELAARLQTNLDAALASLNTCINSGTAFVDNPKASYVSDAMNKIDDFDEVLNEAATWITRNH